VFLDSIGAWTQLIVGSLALISSLGGLWVTERERDRTSR